MIIIAQMFYLSRGFRKIADNLRLEFWVINDKDMKSI